MTLINTVVSRLGILQLSDSNVTRYGGSVVEEQKLFRLKIASSVLSLAGTYSFQGERPATWLTNVQDNFALLNEPPTLGGFSKYVGRLLTINATDYEREEGHLIHLTGYQKTDDGGVRPEMWFVRTWAAMDALGNYADSANPVLVTEDFWSRYQGEPTSGNQRALQYGGWVYFVNGLAEGRVAFNKVRAESPSDRDRTVSSLAALAAIFKEDMEVILGEVAPDIGGEIQMETIEPPGDVSITW